MADSFLILSHNNNKRPCDCFSCKIEKSIKHNIIISFLFKKPMWPLFKWPFSWTCSRCCIGLFKEVFVGTTLSGRWRISWVKGILSGCNVDLLHEPLLSLCCKLKLRWAKSCMVVVVVAAVCEEWDSCNKSKCNDEDCSNLVPRVNRASTTKTTTATTTYILGNEIGVAVALGEVVQ